MRPGFFVRFFASFFDVKAEHFPSFFTSTAAAEQPRNGHLGALEAAPLGLSGGPESRFRALDGSASWGWAGSRRRCWATKLEDARRLVKLIVFCCILQGFRAFGRPRAALRKTSRAPPEAPGSPRTKRPRSKPSETSATRRTQVGSPREGYLTALRMISTS